MRYWWLWLHTREDSMKFNYPCGLGDPPVGQNQTQTQTQRQQKIWRKVKGCPLCYPPNKFKPELLTKDTIR